MGVRLIIAAVLSVLWVGPVAAADSATRPGDSFRDGPGLPEMVVVPAGQFRMGASEAETSREGVPNQYAAWEMPPHKVMIPKAFAIGKYPVTWAEFNAFALDTGYSPSGCVMRDDKDSKFKYFETKSWKDPGFPQDHITQPVVCVSWEDAHKYVSWLSGKTGHAYRLLSETEWEYAARAGTETARWWGDGIGSNNANCNGCGSQWDNKQTSPVGSFKPNSFGLYDMLGNAVQWTEDCWTESYDGAPADGSARTTGDCKRRVIRGGSWNLSPGGVRAAMRIWSGTGILYNYLGFRMAMTLP